MPSLQKKKKCAMFSSWTDCAFLLTDLASHFGLKQQDCWYASFCSFYFWLLSCTLYIDPSIVLLLYSK